MGIGVLILAVIGLILLLLSPISFFILRRKGYKKMAIVVSFFPACVVLIPFFSFLFESELYFKSDAKKDLKELKVVLNDDFQILSNKIDGFPDYFQTTHLLISESDRNRLIEEITHSDNFKILSDNAKTLAFEMDWEESTKKIWNYRQGGFYKKELYENKTGYVPYQKHLFLKKDSDTLLLKITSR